MTFDFNINFKLIGFLKFFSKTDEKVLVDLSDDSFLNSLIKENSKIEENMDLNESRIIQNFSENIFNDFSLKKEFEEKLPTNLIQYKNNTLYNSFNNSYNKNLKSSLHYKPNFYFKTSN